MKIEKFAEFPGHPGSTRSLIFSGDGSLLASSGLDNNLNDEVKLFSVPEPREIDYLKVTRRLGSYGRCLAVGFDATNQLLIAGYAKDEASGFGKLVVFDGKRKRIIAQSRLDKNENYFALNSPHAAAFNRDCTMFAAVYAESGGYPGGDIFVWNLKKGLLGFSLKPTLHRRGRIYSCPVIRFNPITGDLVATQSNMSSSISESGYVAIADVWSINDIALREEIEIDSAMISWVSNIHFDRDGGLFLTNDQSEGRLCIWSQESNRAVTTQHEHSLSTALSPDARILAVGDKEGHFKLWDRRSRQHLVTRKTATEGYGVCSITFSSNGLQLATRADKIEIWNIAD